jgi:hypothetical protein
MSWNCDVDPLTELRAPSPADAGDPSRSGQALARNEQQARVTSCSHARFLSNAIAKEAAAPSSFEARERID